MSGLMVLISSRSGPWGPISGPGRVSAQLILNTINSDHWVGTHPDSNIQPRKAGAIVHELFMSLSDADVDASGDDDSERMALVDRKYPVAAPYVTVAFGQEPSEMERFMCLRAVHFGHLLSAFASHFKDS